MSFSVFSLNRRTNSCFFFFFLIGNGRLALGAASLEIGAAAARNARRGLGFPASIEGTFLDGTSVDFFAGGCARRARGPAFLPFADAFLCCVAAIFFFECFPVPRTGLFDFAFFAITACSFLWFACSLDTAVFGLALLLSGGSSAVVASGFSFTVGGHRGTFFTFVVLTIAPCFLALPLRLRP